MHYIRITKENIDSEHICCAMSGKQSLVKKEWLKQCFEEELVFCRSVGDIRPKDLPRIIWRECRAALLCGGTLAVCNFAKLMLLDRVGFGVSLVVCLTLVCTVLLSQLIGGVLPVIAKKLKMDPAVMASP